MVFHKGQKMTISLVIAILISLLPGVVLAADNIPTQFNYVALGDSLAAGMTPTGGFDLGYTDYIAQKLADDNRLGTFSNFGVAGYTTSDVLAALTYDIAPDPYRGRELVNLREKISKADIITLDAGANDILPNISDYVGNPALALVKCNEVSANIKRVVEIIRDLNSTVKIYIMGYYNPFPYYSQDQQLQIEGLLNLLNSDINEISMTVGAYYVPTAQSIANHTKLYLPIQNIHPSKQGYMAIANDFWSEIKLNLHGE